MESQQVNMAESWTIGIDVGGTKIALAAVSSSGEVLTFKSYLTQAEKGSDLILDTLQANILEMIAGRKSPPDSIGIGLPGQIEEQTGSVLFAPNLAWRNIPLKAILEQK